MGLDGGSDHFGMRFLECMMETGVKECGLFGGKLMMLNTVPRQPCLSVLS